MTLRQFHMPVINFKEGIVCATDGYLRRYNEISKHYAIYADRYGSFVLAKNCSNL